MRSTLLSHKINAFLSGTVSSLPVAFERLGGGPVFTVCCSQAALFFGGEGHSRREATQLKHHEAARGSPASLLLPDYVRVHASFSKPLILGAKWTSSRASPGAFSLVMPSATPQSPRSAGHPAVKESQLTVSSGLQTHSCIMNEADSFNVTG